MINLQQLQIDRLFKSLIAQKVEDQEAFDLWLVRASDFISRALGKDSAFAPLLEDFRQKDTQPSSTNLQSRFEKAKEVLSAAKKHAPLPIAEEDGDLKREAEYAIHQAAARSPWLKIGVAILLVAAGFLITGTINLQSINFDFRARIERAVKDQAQEMEDAVKKGIASLKTHQKELEASATEAKATLEKRQKELEAAAKDGKASLEKLQKENESTLTVLRIQMETVLNAAKENEKAKISNSGSDQVKAISDAGSGQLTAVTNAGSAQSMAINKAGSDRIEKLTGENPPGLLAVANLIRAELEGFEGRLNNAADRQAKIEKNVSGLKALSNRLDETTISELKLLTQQERWAALIIACLALILALTALWRTRVPAGDEHISPRT